MQRTAIVTGATGRIGGAVARALADDGWSLVLGARARTPAADAIAADVAARGGPVRLELADLAEREAALALAARAGPVDALIHCAGRFRQAPILEDDATEWRVDLAVEAEALHTLAVALIPGMRARGYGRVVAFGLAGLDRWPGYRTSTGHAVGKAGMMVVARGLAHALAREPITVNVIAPAAVGDGAPPAIAARAAVHPPEAMADIVRFLLSDAGAAITGAVLPAGGPFGL